MAELPPALRAAIAAAFPADFLTEAPGDRAAYGRDWTRLFPPDPCAVAFPRTTAQVAQLLALCSAHRLPVVPSGGRTGLSGGAVAAQGELVLSLDRLRRLEPVDALGQTVRVQAGAVTAAVHAHAAGHGLTWPVDFASKGQSQVGGNLATNAGGVRVIRYGLARQWVLGLQVVLASGAILELNGGLEKNNTGLDLRQLFIGSEGTLGVITEATLKLCRLPARSDVLLFAVADLAAVLGLFSAARQSGFTVAAFEFFTAACAARVERHRQVRPPLAPASHYVLLELEAAAPQALERWLTTLLDGALVLDGVLAQNASQRGQLWALRESISESLSATGFPHKNDIALPLIALAPFCAELETWRAGDYPSFELCLFGHIGDGNLHVNVMQPEGLTDDAFRTATQAADTALFALVQRHRGTISAEHGIGLLKKPYLHFSRTAGELAAMRAVKVALDPLGILNPGKIFDA